MGSEWTGGPNLIPKGKYGMKQGPSSYLEQRGIGHNLAYKPWMPTAWSPSSDVDEPYKGVPGSRWTTYRQLQEDQGLTNSRPEGYINPIYELLYHYGGKKPGISGRAIPQVVPGGWKPQTPPGGPAVYPLSRVPLFPTGRLSAGYKPSGGGNNNNPPDDGGNNPPGGGTNDPLYGPLLSAYKGMASATPGGMWRITGDPVKATIAGNKTYQLPLSFYGGGNTAPFQTTATRAANSGGWNPSLNTWNVAGNSEFSPANLQLANWTGSQGAYSGTPNFQVQGGLNFLGSPSHTDIQGQRVPFLAQEFGGPVGSTTQGPLGSGAFTNWSLPAMRGLMAGEPTGDVVGYNFPQYYYDDGGGGR